MIIHCLIREAGELLQVVAVMPAYGGQQGSESDTTLAVACFFFTLTLQHPQHLKHQACVPVLLADQDHVLAVRRINGKHGQV